MKATHQTKAAASAARRHEHEYEPQYGLPEVLPADETLLWQGSPDWQQLARRAFHLRKLAAYFGAIIVLRLVLQLADGATTAALLRSLTWMLPLATIGLGLVAMLAWLSARGTAYSITDKRVVMRIGIVLTVTFNLPYSRIRAAGLNRLADGSADLTLTLGERDHIAWLQLWPHVRPWRIAHPEPMLRCVPRGEQVAQILAQAWSAATGQLAEAAPARLATPPQPNPSPTSLPAWAGH